MENFSFQKVNKHIVEVEKGERESDTPRKRWINSFVLQH